MPKLDRGGARHLLMRAGLGFVLSWFGVQELRSPSQWAVFIPSFVTNHSPVAINDLILLHGFLLLLAAAAVVLGLRYLIGCLLAMGLLSEILLGLWLDGGVSDLVIRDLGLLALAGALALDPVRVWHLESVLPALRPFQRRAPRQAKKGKAPLPPPSLWPVQAGGAAVLVAAVLGLAFLLHVTGSSGTPAPVGAAAALPSSSTAAPRDPTPAAPVATATPAPSTPTVRFDDWQYKQYAFQVYPGDISPDAKKALAGFDLSVQDQGAKVLLVLKALSPRYQDASLTVDKGNTAYFIETSMRDDPNDLENNLRDDGVIVVNPQGFILPRS